MTYCTCHKLKNKSKHWHMKGSQDFYVCLLHLVLQVPLWFLELNVHQSLLCVINQLTDFTMVPTPHQQQETEHYWLAILKSWHKLLHNLADHAASLENMDKLFPLCWQTYSIHWLLCRGQDLWMNQRPLSK